ncbi:putative bifunctional diguanylate cyclase/phosphodiesterase [Roseibium sediminicola]|uniref:EAL domain-containing protein n=1 Tax=Roseibium sediminicola TaxID=2933272 RepID=A0ABT0GR06_9HYPH|nr:EAL domain-containing protein [Roseibium sp. CAU 1639]MCK7611871.1 EAL domain-containing protein [Roseibium sp. CAU 1639]
MSWFQAESGDPDVARAQYQLIQRQTPFLYLMSLAGGWALVATHWSVAPLGVTLVLPSLITAFALFRIATLRRRQKETPSFEGILKWQKHAMVLSVVSPGLLSIWALSLFPYGGPYLQLQVVFTIAVVNLVVLFCLIHFRKVAIINAFCANSLYFLYFLINGEPIFTYFALYGICASIGAFFILNNHYRDFIRLVHSSRDLRNQAVELERRQDETQKLSDLNYHIANYDHLTGLPNRRCFLAELETRFKATRDQNASVSLCVFDLGGLRAINSIYGVKTGDDILSEVVRRLRSRLSAETFAARLAGDEFALLSPSGSPDLARPSALFEDLFEEACQLPESSVRLNFFAGIAITDMALTSATELLERAVYAMQEAKQNRNNPIVVFGHRHLEHMGFQTRITQALQAADIEREFSVAFQPIVDVNSNRITGVECLARWTSPLLGQVPPGDFITVAERSGMINKLTLVLLGKALVAARDWPLDLKVSFNLSASNLSSRGFVREFLKLLKDHAFDPVRLNCEVTETSVMWDFAEANRAIAILKNAGIRLSLDDFGTGYSSLSHVHQLPLDCIKVDRSFVQGIKPDTIGYGIVKSLLAMSREMGISCVVEGVETEEELAVLRSLGTSEVQGYLFSKPVGAPELEALLNGKASLGGQSGARPASATKALTA